MATFTIDDLGRIINECAGTSDSVEWSASVLDTTFEELGYDSIAMLEVASRVQQVSGVRIEDAQVFELSTPRAFLAHVSQSATQDV